MKNIITSIILSVMLLGCNSIQLSKNATAQQRAMAAIKDAETGLKFVVPPAITTWLLLEKDETKRASDAAMVFAASNALYTLSTGKTFTVTEVQNTIQTFTNTSPRYALLAQYLTSTYSTVFNSYKLAGTSPAKFFAEVATLAGDAAKPYLATTTN